MASIVGWSDFVDDAKRAQEAKDRAKSYLHPQAPSADDNRSVGPKEESDWTDIVGQRIEQAMREGAFDNLPGRGQPLNLTKNPFVPDDQQMAFKLLDNNDLRPVWISERNQVLAEITRLRSTIAATVRTHRQEYKATEKTEELDHLSSSWSYQIEEWTAEIVDLNKRIEILNLQQPVAQLEIIKLRLDNELAKAGVSHDIKSSLLNRLC